MIYSHFYYLSTEPTKTPEIKLTRPKWCTFNAVIKLKQKRGGKERKKKKNNEKGKQKYKQKKLSPKTS